MEQAQLNEILAGHKAWLKTRVWGQQANLAGADLVGADLTWANLARANLTWADLTGANLTGADLAGANLTGADLTGANLTGANLTGANLARANLTWADLTRTVLDPNNAPNGEVGEFLVEGDYVIGYRTRKAGHIDQYRDGRIYAADWFSTCTTECHPGLYLWPTIKAAKNWSSEALIKVRTKPADVHKAGGKWRCRWFEVLGAVD